MLWQKLQEYPPKDSCKVLNRKPALKLLDKGKKGKAINEFLTSHVSQNAWFLSKPSQTDFVFSAGIIFLFLLQL